MNVNYPRQPKEGDCIKPNCSRDKFLIINCKNKLRSYAYYNVIY